MTLSDASLESLSRQATDLSYDAGSHPEAELAWQHMDDTQLVEICQAELPYVTDAFEALMRRYEPLVFHSCRHYLGNAADAEETSQDIFLRIFYALPRFEGRSSFRTWLFRIVYNCCVTKRSKLIERAKQREAYSQEFPDDWWLSAWSSSDSASGFVADTLTSLSAEDQQILQLRFIGELSFEEIAQTMDISLSAAKMRVYRAAERFRAHYKTLVGGEEQVWLFRWWPESNTSVQKKKRVKRDSDEPEEEDLARIFTLWRMGWRSDPAREERLLIHIRYHASLQTRQTSDTGH